MRPLHFVIPLAIALGASAAPFTAHAQIALDVSINQPPPELPVYEQPPLPAPGYIFMPGYWAYGDEGYYWVPATWVEPPEPGLLWTPGYWGWNSGRYLFNAGYWGATVGYYGGINYGFGYGGFGYEGGYWRGGVFNYNRAVNRFGGVHVTNVYERNVTHVTVNRYSFNGPGGVNRQPRPEELAAARETHVPPTAMQTQHFQEARHDRALLASVNHGRPAVLATPRPIFNGTAGRAPVAGRAPAMAHPMGQAPGPHPVGGHATAPNRPFGGGVAHPGAVSPHPVAHPAMPYAGGRPMTPRQEPGMQGGMAPREQMAPRQSMAPRPMQAPRPMGAPQGMGMGAPHPAQAPHPAPAQREEKPKH
jgi:hypothetical protein